METNKTPEFAHAVQSRKSESGGWNKAAKLLAILTTFAFSGAQAQQIFIEPFNTDAAKDPSTTADWDTGTTDLKLPTTGSALPIQSLINSFQPGDISVSLDIANLEITRAVAVGDMNGDGFPDLVFGNSGRNSIYFNDGFGGFNRGSVIPDDYFGAGNTRSVALADFDGNGYLDVVFAEFGSGQATRIHFNNGSGTGQVFDALDFVDLGAPVLGGDSVAVGDIDGDNDIDVVLGIDNGHVRFFRNDGFGNFSGEEIIVDSSSPAFGFHARTVLLGDLDRDGDLDIVAAREVAPTRIYLNNGSGSFATQESAGVGVNNALPAPDSATLGDVNGDGFLDLFVGNDSEGSVLGPLPNYLFLNSGNPANVFPAVSFTFSDNVNTDGGIFIDVDRDGDLDIVTADMDVGNSGPSTPGENRLYLNDGSGTFPANGTFITADTDVTKSLASGDFDRDGKLDLVFANEPGGGSNGDNRIVLNVGTASGLNADQLFAFGQSIQVGAGANLSNGMMLEPLTGTTDPESNRVFRYWLSADAGANWILAHPNRSVAFATVPNPHDLRWRVELNSPSPMIRPDLDQLLLRTNGAPSFTSAVVDTATQDVLYEYNIETADTFGDLVDIRVGSGTTLPAWLTLTDNNDGTALLAGTPTNDDVGTTGNDVTLEVVDGAGQTATQGLFTITVADVNDPPTVVAPTGDQNFDQNTDPALDVSGAFSDPEGDELAYSATGLPASLTIDSVSGIISGTLTNDDVLAGPDFNVVVTATEVGTVDLFSVDDAFTLTVNDVNDAPVVIAGTADQAFDEDTAVSLDASLAFEDPDGDALTYAASGLPASLSIDPASGLITGTLTNADVLAGPDYIIIVTATELGTADSFSVDDTFSLTVGAVDTTPPVITLVGPATVTLTVGDAYADQGATASDDFDGDITANIVTVNPVDTNTAGTYTVTYNVSDAAGNAAAEVTRTVTVNDPVDTTPPVITRVGPATVSLTVGGTYTDQGATAMDDVDGDITANIVTVNPVNTNAAGTYTVTYDVMDTSGNAAMQVTRTVTVNAAPPPPPPPPPPSGGGGGSTSPALLLLLAGLLLGRRRRQLLDN